MNTAYAHLLVSYLPNNEQNVFRLAGFNLQRGTRLRRVLIPAPHRATGSATFGNTRGETKNPLSQ